MAKANYVTISGLDISLSNLGMSLFRFYPSSGDLLPIKCQLVTTEPENKKAKIRKNCDDLNRARKLWDGLYAFTEHCDFNFMELPVGSQTARAMASYGVCCGVAAGLPNLITVLPMEVKAVTGMKNATKAQMIKWAVDEFPELQWAYRTIKGETSLIASNEHVADSCAAAIAGLGTPEFKNALKFFFK